LGGSRFFIRPFVFFSTHEFTSFVTSRAFKTISNKKLTVQQDKLNSFSENFNRIIELFDDIIVTCSVAK
jgi:hypothetical protein